MSASFTRSLAVVIAAGFAASAGVGQSASAAPQCPAPHQAPDYIADGQMDLVSLLPPPPASEAQTAELRGVLEAQAEGHKAGTTDRAVADSELSCARFKDVMGPALKSPAAANALRFLSDAALNAAAVSGRPKMYWKRPRPYLLSAEVERLADIAPGGHMANGENPPDPACAPGAGGASGAPDPAAVIAARQRDQMIKDYSSYPSGHSAFGYSCALLLAAMVPEQRNALFARGREYGRSRMLVGAHYASDVEAGRTLATVAVAVMEQNRQFQVDFERSRHELRAALALPAEPGNLEPPGPPAPVPAPAPTR